MTIKVVVTHDQPTDTRAIAVQYTNQRGELGMSGPDILEPGESGTYWVHSGQLLKVYEI